MDPRSQRSRDRLTTAVIRFARAGRLDDVSVSELARAAEVTRDTFYRHASSVTELLSIALADKLAELVAETNEQLPTRAELGGVLSAGELRLLRHIEELAPVYRTALAGQSAAPVRRTLTGFLQRNLEVALRVYPDIAPIPEHELDDESVAVLAAYAASGTVGAIEVWLSCDEPRAVADVRRIIKAGAPEWWVRATGGAA